VKTGLGTGCVIKQFITEELENGQIVEISTPNAMNQRDVSFAYSALVPLTGATKAFVDYIEHSKVIS